MKIQNNIPSYLKAVKTNPSMSSIIAQKGSKNSSEKLFEMVEKRSKNIRKSIKEIEWTAIVIYIIGTILTYICIKSVRNIK